MFFNPKLKAAFLNTKPAAALCISPQSPPFTFALHLSILSFSRSKPASHPFAFALCISPIPLPLLSASLNSLLLWILTSKPPPHRHTHTNTYSVNLTDRLLLDFFFFFIELKHTKFSTQTSYDLLTGSFFSCYWSFHATAKINKAVLYMRKVVPWLMYRFLIRIGLLKANPCFGLIRIGLLKANPCFGLYKFLIRIQTPVLACTDSW